MNVGSVREQDRHRDPRRGKAIHGSCGKKLLFFTPRRAMTILLCGHTFREIDNV
jgi:hypothetical protein